MLVSCPMSCASQAVQHEWPRSDAFGAVWPCCRGAPLDRREADIAIHGTRHATAMASREENKLY